MNNWLLDTCKLVTCDNTSQGMCALQTPAFFDKIGWVDSAQTLRFFEALRTGDVDGVAATTALGFTVERLPQDEMPPVEVASDLVAGLFESPLTEGRATLRLWEGLCGTVHAKVAVSDLDEGDSYVRGRRQLSFAFCGPLALGAVMLADPAGGAATKTDAIPPAAVAHEPWTATAMAIELELVTLRSAADTRALPVAQKLRLRALEEVAPLLRNALLEVDAATVTAPLLTLPGVGGLTGASGKPSRPVPLPPTALRCKVVDGVLTELATECSFLMQLARAYAALGLPLHAHRYFVDRVRTLQIRAGGADDGASPRSRRRARYACGANFVGLDAIPRWSDYIAAGAYAQHRGGSVPPWRGFLESARLPIPGRPALVAGATVTAQLPSRTIPNRRRGVVARDRAGAARTVDVRFPSSDGKTTTVIAVPIRAIDGWTIPPTKPIPRAYLKRKASPNAALNAKISLYQGDMLTLEVDCVVNAANGTLLGGGGIDGAMHNAAGAWLKEECRLHAGAEDGEAKLTRGYDLPADYIIHAVGPRCQYRPRSEGGGIILDPPALRRCYRSCLDLVAQHGLKSIAFCAISTGIFGYPVHDATTEALNVVRTWLEEEGHADAIERIVFVTYGDQDTAAYQAILPAFFPAEGSEEASGDCLVC